MYRHFRRAIQPYVDHRRTCARGGIALHAVAAPVTTAEFSGTVGIQGHGDTTGQADLTAVGMAAQKNVVARMGSLAPDFRCVTQQNADTTRGNLVSCPVQIMRLVEMGL